MQSKKGNAVVWILVILVLAGLVWAISSKRGNENNDDMASTTVDIQLPATTTPTATTTGGAVNEPKTVVIEYTASGFSPSTVTIKKGDTVRWVNKTSEEMWVASAMHPAHTVYSGTTLQQHCTAGAANNSFDQCANGNTYEFTFDKTGEWGYHNHSDASDFGKVIVQ